MKLAGLDRVSCEAIIHINHWALFPLLYQITIVIRLHLHRFLLYIREFMQHTGTQRTGYSCSGGVRPPVRTPNSCYRREASIEASSFYYVYFTVLTADVLTLGNWIHRVDACSRRRPRMSSTGTLRVLADIQEQHHGHTSTRAERSWRWLADVLEASGDCVDLATYGHSVELVTLTEPQCYGLL